MIANPKSKWSAGFRLSLNRVTREAAHRDAMTVLDAEMVKYAGYDRPAVQTAAQVAVMQQRGWDRRFNAVY